MAIRNRIGRNEPCPCGSGGKFKRCHGRGPSSTIVPEVKHMIDTGEAPIRWVITNQSATSFFVDKQKRVLVFPDRQMATELAGIELFADQGPNEIHVAGVGPTKWQKMQEMLPFFEVPSLEIAVALIEERVRDQREKLGYSDLPPSEEIS
jgi:hypothetical protein